jgi:hypothetical protein
MADEPRGDAAPESAYEGRDRPSNSESLTGTRVGRGATPPTGQGGSTGDAAEPHPILDELEEEIRREGGGAPRERQKK